MSIAKTKIREAFKAAVFQRDGNKCVFCKNTSLLDAHHITDRSDIVNGGYVLENGITVCAEHHLACELFHVTDGKEFHKGYHPDDLYRAINSSKEQAIEASKKLWKQPY